MGTVLKDIGFPFTDQGGDRLYSASDWREYFDALVTGGVVGNIANELKVMPQGVPNKSVYVDTGSVIIKGAMRAIESTLNLTIADNASGNPRIDHIVARLNYVDRKIEFVVKQGVPAASPSAPALVQNTSTWEYSLAKIALANGYTTITAANITDERSDEAVCGYFKYRAKPAWYPEGKVSIDAWLYTHFKDQLTAQEQLDIKNNASLMSKINESSISKLAKQSWVLLSEFNVAGANNWVAPDLNNGQPYEIGIFIMGGGGSGGAVKYQHASNATIAIAIGGSAGRSAFKKQTVSPGTTIPLVVASGGVAKVTTTSGNSLVVGADGGSSSCSGLTAAGGSGGNAFYSTGGYGSDGGEGSTAASPIVLDTSAFLNRNDQYAPVHGDIPRDNSYGASIYRVANCYLSEARDPFTQEPIGGAGGGAMSYYNGSKGSQLTKPQANGLYAGRGMDGGSADGSISAVAATSPGSAGGGAALVGNVVNTATATSGAGKSGFVKIYVRGVIL